ncbi:MULTISPECIES: hypothetical protein [Azorhizobium]|nr:hypothetical protein [Azorhizobium sp. AG788]TDT87728.1 hypothetical protein DFO45_4945 [Azorhizobium sp. AG788]
MNETDQLGAESHEQGLTADDALSRIESVAALFDAMSHGAGTEAAAQN